MHDKTKSPLNKIIVARLKLAWAAIQLINNNLNITDMKVTFVLKNLTDFFYKKLEESTNKYDFLNKQKDLQITKKVGNGEFNQSVYFSMNYLNKGKTYKSYKLESRRGYKLVTFIF